MYRASCTVYCPDRQMHIICCAFVGLDNKNVVQNEAILYNAIHHAIHSNIIEAKKKILIRGVGKDFYIHTHTIVLR